MGFNRWKDLMVMKMYVRNMNVAEQASDFSVKDIPFTLNGTTYINDKECNKSVNFYLDTIDCLQFVTY